MATRQVVAIAGSPGGLWNPINATGLIVIGIALGMAFVWVTTRKQKVRVVRPFLCGEVPVAGGPVAPRIIDTPGSPDRFRMPGTHFYKTIGKLPIIGGWIANAQLGAMDVYHWSAKHGKTFVELLRAQHTGLLNLYVAWVVIGLVVTLAYLLISTYLPAAGM